GEELAGGVPYPGVAGGAEPRVRLADQPEPRVPLGEVGRDVRAPVGRPVVDHDDLEVPPGLGRDRRQAGLQVRLHVVARDDHADSWHGGSFALVVHRRLHSSSIGGPGVTVRRGARARAAGAGAGWWYGAARRPWARRAARAAAGAPAAGARPRPPW